MAIAKAHQSGYPGDMEEEEEVRDDEGDESDEEPPLPPTPTLHQARLQAAALLQFCRENIEQVGNELADAIGDLSDNVQRMQVTARMREKPLTAYFKKIDKDGDSQ